MNKSLIAGAVALALAAPGVSLAATAKKKAAPAAAAAPAVTADDLKAMRDQMQALSDRLQRLEQANQQLQQQNAELQAQNKKLATDTEEVVKSNDAQTDAIAKTSAKVAAADWASKIKFSGDARYRDEEIKRDLRQGTQTRDRIRARFGFSAKVNDDISVGMRLATGADDPRSSNQTLGAAGTPLARRTIGLDQYWISWKPVSEVTILGGKFPIPYWRPGQSLLNDSDINPEGIAANWTHGVFFANAYGFWMTERTAATTTGAATISTTSQGTTYSGLQLGLKFPLGDASTFTVAAMYSDLGAGQGRMPFWFAGGTVPTSSSITCKPITGTLPQTPSCSTTTTNNINGIAAAANGNTLDASGNLAQDFQQAEVMAEYATKINGIPLSIWANFETNTAAKAIDRATVTTGVLNSDKLDKAYTAGFLLGKASDKNTWEIGYAYEKLEKDSYFGQFVDSDFGAGVTDTKGSVIRLGYAPAKNWTLNATYFINKLNISGASTFIGSKQDEEYKRLQLDFNVKY
jgi:hypothetical protein